MSTFYSSPTQGFTESFLQHPHSSRDLLGACLADSSFPDGAKKRLIQSVRLQFPCLSLLHQWGKEDSPNCPHFNERESLGHIQSRCKILEKPRISAHHMIWRKILLQLFSLSGDEGDEHKWVIPSAVSADSHKELTVCLLRRHQAHQERKVLWRFRHVEVQGPRRLCSTGSVPLRRCSTRLGTLRTAPRRTPLETTVSPSCCQRPSGPAASAPRCCSVSGNAIDCPSCQLYGYDRGRFDDAQRHDARRRHARPLPTPTTTPDQR